MTKQHIFPCINLILKIQLYSFMKCNTIKIKTIRLVPPISLLYQHKYEYSKHYTLCCIMKEKSGCFFFLIKLVTTYLTVKCDFIQCEMLFERLNPCCITLVTLTLNYYIFK